MTTTRARGRYRAQVRPKTPLSVLSDAVSANAGTMSRRSAVIAASSGLVVTMGLPAAGAAPVTDVLTPDTPQETTGAIERVEVPAEPAAEVTVPADATVSFASSAVSSVEAPPPPPPPPPPVVEPEREERPSRDTTRESLSRDSSSDVEESSASGGSIVAIAARYVGTPYVYGGTSPDGFDCSGFTQYVYRQAGISIPRTSGAQGSGGRRVSASEARPGDLVWSGNGHIGIYAGGDQMYDAPRTGKSVAKRTIWYTPIFVRY